MATLFFTLVFSSSVDGHQMLVKRISSNYLCINALIWIMTSKSEMGPLQSGRKLKKKKKENKNKNVAPDMHLLLIATSKHLLRLSYCQVSDILTSFEKLASFIMVPVLVFDSHFLSPGCHYL